MTKANERPGAFPSHVTIIQVARMVGVARQSVTGRIEAGHMATMDYGGEPMVRVTEVRAWIKERHDAALAHLARVTP